MLVLPRVVTPNRFAAEVTADFVDRLSASWGGGGKVLIASDGSLKKVRLPGRKELVPQGSTGWVYGLAPADFSGGQTERVDVCSRVAGKLREIDRPE